MLPAVSELYLADVAGAMFNSALICGTMLPLAVYCGKILLQVGLVISHSVLYVHVVISRPDCTRTYPAIAGQVS